MAGTRRQARGRDTTNSHQHRRSVSQATSVVKETAIAATSEAVSVGTNLDEDSPRPETSINRSTTAYCKKCDGKIGDFYNSWHKVTSSYYSPALFGSYRSLLRTAGQRKEASSKTELAGCNIDLTYCPNCDECLGFVVIDAPANGRRFRGRDFFKLQRVELRCEVSPSKIIVVEPQEDVAPDLVASEGSISPSFEPNNTAAETMDIDSPPLSSSHPLWSRPAQSEVQQKHERSQSREFRSQLPPPNGTLPSSATTRSPAGQNVTLPPIVHATARASTSPQPAQLRPESAVGSSLTDVPPASAVNGLKNGYSYPRQPQEVYFEAIERLQTQTANNTSALAAQARGQGDYAEMIWQMETSLRREFQTHLHRQDQDLRRMHDSVEQLRQELQECHRFIAGLTHDVRALGDANPHGAPQHGHQDAALETMARNIADISHRTSEFENLRNHVAIMNGKILRLESQPAPAHSQHPHPTQIAEQPAHPTHIAHAAPPPPAQLPQFQTPARPASGPPQVPSHETPVAVGPPESAQRHEPAPSQNGWATVNAGIKRVFPSDSPPQGASSAPGSPKRPRLVTEESQNSQGTPQIPAGPSHILPSQPQSVVDSQPQSLPNPQSVPPLASQAELQSKQYYASYSTQGSPSDEIWRSESQRMAESRPARGRGSRGGRGPGSRGGRVRKSMQTHAYHFGTPDPERDGWQGVHDSQGRPHSFEDHSAHSARSISRRGGGGAGGIPGGYSPMDRSTEWTPQTGPRSTSFESPSDVKKSRSKPVRNADGILIRKDGRPDMRSQSSAANLRKVHARKEEQQREEDSRSTPTGLHYSMSAGPGTPSPSPHSNSEQNLTDSVRKKHNDILGKIFPDGLDSSRKQHDYAHQVFNEDRDHTAHPRSQTSQRGSKTSLQIKKEQTGHNESAKTRASVNGDVDMQDAEHSTNGQLASDVRRSGHNQNRVTEGEKETSTVQIPETQATEDSVAVVAESVEAT